MVKPILFEQSSEAPRAVIVMHRDIDAWKTAFCEPPQCDGQQPFAETSVMVEIDFESTDFKRGPESSGVTPVQCRPLFSGRAWQSVFRPAAPWPLEFSLLHRFSF